MSSASVVDSSFSDVLPCALDLARKVDRKFGGDRGAEALGAFRLAERVFESAVRSLSACANGALPG